MKDKYLKAFMKMTEVFSSTSESKRLQVGACLIKNENPIAFGVNGTIPGWHTNACEDEYGRTHDAVLHAEIQALNKLRKISESGVGATLLVTHSPCIRCAHEIFDSGIVSVYYKNEYRDMGGIEYLKSKGVLVNKLE